MSDDTTSGNGGQPAAPQGAPAAQQPRFQVLAQYVRDFSFENAAAQKGLNTTDVQPEIQVAISLDARKRATPNHFEVISKYKVTSKNRVNGDVLFMVELDYGAAVVVEGVPEDQLHPFLTIEVPRLTFPFVRRIIADATHDGGFPALNIDMVDFVALYRQELARRSQQAGVTPGGPGAGTVRPN
mgnify:CR=1 FL=1